MTDVTDELTPEEVVELQKYLGGGGSPSPEEKHSVHKFLADVSTSDDTTKTGNLDKDEIGMPKNPVRTYKNISLICSDIMDNPYLRDHFTKEGEILTSTSLSKDAKLINLSVISRRQLEDVTKPKKVNKGWFSKKDKGGGEQ